MQIAPRTWIRHLSLRNYRCFNTFAIDFHPELTIFVAPNGGGKTAILDAIAIAFRLFVDTLEGRSQSKGFEHSDMLKELSPDNTMELRSPTTFEASAEIDGRSVSWSRSLITTTPHARTTSRDAPELKAAAMRLKEQHEAWVDRKSPESPILPLFAFYGTGRLWGMEKLTDRKKSKETAPTSRLNGYIDCLSSSSRYKFFLDWFERFSREGQKESSTGKYSLHRPEQKLRVVQAAVDKALTHSGWHSIAWDFAEETVYAEHPVYGRLAVDSLSDGIRNMIGLISDIAHRAARLNPHLEEEAALRTPGTVLIDEIDMHLHPQWQQEVLQSLREAFPVIQFIITTHSPQVLTTVAKDNIRIIDRDESGSWTASMPKTSPLAQPSGDALAKVMDVDPRPDLHIGIDIHAYEDLVKQGKIDTPEAQEILKRLISLGYDIPDSDLALWRFISKKRSSGS